MSAYPQLRAARTQRTRSGSEACLTHLSGRAFWGSRSYPTVGFPLEAPRLCHGVPTPWNAELRVGHVYQRGNRYWIPCRDKKQSVAVAASSLRRLTATWVISVQSSNTNAVRRPVSVSKAMESPEPLEPPRGRDTRYAQR